MLVLVADRIIENLTVDDLKKFKHTMNEIMGNKLVKVLRVKGGSVIITFRMFEVEDENFVITDEQQQTLQREGVIRIIYGEKCFDIRANPRPGMGVSYTKNYTMSSHARRVTDVMHGYIFRAELAE